MVCLEIKYTVPLHGLLNTSGGVRRGSFQPISTKTLFQKGEDYLPVSVSTRQTPVSSVQQWDVTTPTTVFGSPVPPSRLSDFLVLMTEPFSR